ncbi:ABC transporter permease [uncultured Cellulomonas sp.]|uniref:ABC transporter permease n=1 Tax=uncultured Cellulomonas sp. TaxID=189682 RepID=UPI00261E62D6|nr:ABC transporter permease [uncultured Cellulomonas sp.]
MHATAAPVPVAAPRSRAPRQLLDQLAHACVGLWRARVVLVFTLALPLVWLLVIGVLAGNATVEGAGGVRLMQFVTPVAAAMGVLYAAFPTVAISLTQARELGTVRRVRGTPMPVRVFLAARIGAAAAYALAAVTAVLALAVVAYDVQIVWRTVPATLVTLLVGTVCFAAMGVAFSVLSPSTAVAQAGSIATAVVLTFVSGMFTVGGTLPTWLDRAGSALPLKPFVEALQHQFNPFRAGAGWEPGALAVIAAWGIVAAAVATRWSGRVRDDGRTARRAGPVHPGHRPLQPLQPVQPPQPHQPLRATGRPDRVRTHRVPTSRPGTGRVAAGALVAGQVSAAVRSTRRDPGAVFFALVLPVGLYALMVTMQGASFEIRPGVRFADVFAASMVTWGTAVTAFMNVPESVATARDRGVLKRLRGTPLRPWHYLAGRTTAGLALILVVAASVLVVGRGAYGVRPTLGGLLLGLGVLVVGMLSLAACGFALAALAPDAGSVGAVGLVVLLPLAFFSDVFINDVPTWMSRVGDLFPLKHLQNALAAAWDPAGASIGWVHVGVLLAWALGAGLVAVRRFRWDAAATTPGPRPGRPADQREVTP